MRKTIAEDVQFFHISKLLNVLTNVVDSKQSAVEILPLGN